MPLVKSPFPDDSLLPFDGGVGVITRDGRRVGRGSFRTGLDAFARPPRSERSSTSARLGIGPDDF